MRQLRVVIIGAGLGGLALARGLLSAGHRVTVHEQAEALRTSGAALAVYSNGTGVLGSLGVRTEDLGSRLRGIDAGLDTGRSLGVIDLDAIARTHGSPSLVLPRAQLLHRLADGLPADCVRFGARCTEVGQDAAGAFAVFADGTRAEADLLIGADGCHSVVRRHLVGGDAAPLTGLASWHGMSKAAGLLPAERGRALYGEAGYCGMLPAGEDLVQWWFELPWSPGDTAPPDAAGLREGRPLDNLRDRFGGWTSPVPALLDSIVDDDVQVYPHVLHPVPRRWQSGRIAMLGDAVHALPPTLGQGSNQALEDAWMLNRMLARSGEVSEALRRYERARLPRMRLLSGFAASSARKPLHESKAIRRAPALPMTLFNRMMLRTFGNYLGSRNR